MKTRPASSADRKTASKDTADQGDASRQTVELLAAATAAAAEDGHLAGRDSQDGRGL